MASSKEFSLSIILRAVDRATATFRTIEKKTGQLSKKLDRVGKSLTTNLTLPILGLGAASVKAMADFETGMSNVGTLIDENVESLDAMGKQVLGIGKRVGVPLADLTNGLYDVRSAGIAAANQFDVLEKSARLGVAGRGSTQQAVDLVTSSLNAFQLEGAEAARTYDLIFKTVKSGKTTIADLSQGFGSVAGQVHASGTQLDEYLASVAALTTTGLPAAQAHTQLRAVLSGLTRDTEDTRRVFRKLGAKDFRDLIVKSGGLVPALERISGALDGNQSKILKLVGSSEALNAILGLTGAQNKVYASTLDDMRNGAVAVDEAFEKQNKTMRARAIRTRNALSSAGIAIGRILTPALEKLTEWINKAVDWFDSLDESTKKWIVGIAAAAAAIGPLLVVGGKLLALLSFMTGPIGLLIIGLSGLAYAGYELYQGWHLVEDFFAQLWNDIRTSAFGRFLSWFAGTFLEGFIAPTRWLIENWRGVGEFFKGLWDGIVGIFQKAWELIQAIVDKVLGAADAVVNAAKTAYGFASDPTGAEFDKVGAPNAGTIFGRRLADRARRSLGDVQRRSLGVTPPVAAGSAETRIKLDITGAPRGTRAEIAPDSDGDVDLSLGYQMGAVP